MSDNSRLKPLSIALGAAFATSLAAGSACATGNPFGQTELASGYRVAAAGEGKCGAGMTQTPAPTAPVKATMEGKCGEGKCGAMNMNQAPVQDKATQEGRCGAGKTPMDGTGKPE